MNLRQINVDPVPLVALFGAISVWLVVGQSNWATREESPTWWLLWLLFGIAMPVGHEWQPHDTPSLRGRFALLVQVVAAFGLLSMDLFLSNHDPLLDRRVVIFLLAINAGRAAVQLPLRWGLGLIALQSLFLVIINARSVAISSAPFDGLLLSTAAQLLIFVWAGGSLRSRKMHEVQRQTVSELEASAALLRSSARREREAEILRDLHDSAGHSMTALILQLQAAAAIPEQRQEKVALAEQTARAALEEIRSFAREHRRDFRDSIQQMVSDADEAYTGGRIRAELDPEFSTHDPDFAELFYRTVQEGLTNAMRHSRAEHITVIGRISSSEFSLQVRDDGIGDRHRGARALPARPDPDAPEPNGLAGLRARAQKLGATIETGNLQPRGFELGLKVARIGDTS